jgi:hypothetical protein
MQHVKIYLPCTFEVNPITHFGVIALFSSPGLRPCELLPSLFVCLSTFHILIFSSETTGPIFNQTLVEWSLDGPLPKLCPVIPTSNQDGHQAKNRNQRLPGACNRSPGSKLLSITTQLHCGSHLGGRAQLPDTILEEDHPMTIPSKFGFN